MEEKNRWTSLVLFLSAPFIFLIISNQGPPAIGLLLNETSWAPFAYYGVSIGIGYLLYRRSRVVKDMEWHRSKSIQRLDKVYRAEDRGVWLRADAADERLTVEAQRRPVDSRAKTAARLQGSIADVNREGEPEEIESSAEDVENVELFLEQEHVVRSTERVTGKSGPVESVKGITKDIPAQENEGLVRGALSRLARARERAAMEQVESMSKPQGKIRNASQVESRAPAPQVKVIRGQDYDPSPSNIDSQMDEKPVQSSEPLRALRRCVECGSAMSDEDAYCPKCGAFAL
jgi:hypothetical protein